VQRAARVQVAQAEQHLQEDGPDARLVQQRPGGGGRGGRAAHGRSGVLRVGGRADEALQVAAGAVLHDDEELRRLDEGVEVAHDEGRAEARHDVHLVHGAALLLLAHARHVDALDDVRAPVGAPPRAEHLAEGALAEARAHLEVGQRGLRHRGRHPARAAPFFWKPTRGRRCRARDRAAWAAHTQSSSTAQRAAAGAQRASFSPHGA
jgi:hypothetical protein